MTDALKKAVDQVRKGKSIDKAAKANGLGWAYLKGACTALGVTKAVSGRKRGELASRVRVARRKKAPPAITVGMPRSVKPGTVYAVTRKEDGTVILKPTKTESR